MNGKRSACPGIFLLLAGCSTAIHPPAKGDQTIPRADVRLRPPARRQYLVAQRTGPLTIDGKPDEAAWQRASWSDPFVDIEGKIRPAPRYRTRMKMLYDDSALYVAAELQEPDLWATIRQHDAVIFQDNDFELFIDPTGTTQRYYEIEVNQFATEWDLFLPKAYRDGGKADNSWEIPGLRVMTATTGTINHPGDKDVGWTVELAIPWSAFADSGMNVVPPHAGSQWRINFSRVEWDTDTIGGMYVRKRDDNGKLLPEHNWVWTPQGAVNMHLPELWGMVQFGGSSVHLDKGADYARWALRRVYYAEHLYQQAHKRYTTDFRQLNAGVLPDGIELVGTATTWSATLAAQDGVWRIAADGKIWREP